MAKKEEKFIVDIIRTGKTPTYATPGSTGADLYACISDDITIHPKWVAKVPLGIYTAIPEGYSGLILPRSGLAEQHLVTILNAPADIDSDYRGEWQALVINFGNIPFTVHNGDRIAQVIFVKTEKAEFNEVDKLSDTERGSGGFGHTGV